MSTDPLIVLLDLYAEELKRYEAIPSPRTREEDDADAAGWQRIYCMETFPKPTSLEDAARALRAVLVEEGDDLCSFSERLIKITLAYLDGLVAEAL